MSFLLDTDVCSAHLKTSPALTSRLVQHAGRLHVSVITAGELLTWARRRDAPSQRMAAIRDFFRDVQLAPIDERVAEVFAHLRAAQLDAGRPTPLTDLWIGATAIAHNLTLVTHNLRDFEHVQGLTIIDWLTN